MVEQQHTEKKIFEAASRVFRRKGFAGTRMQEIADEAGINKSILHYYYQNKDQLFYKVLQEEISYFFPVIVGILDSNDALDEKIAWLIDTFYSILQDNPHIGRFMFLEMDQHTEQFYTIFNELGIRPSRKFSDEIREEIMRGNMDPVKPEQLMANIFGLILFPFVSQTMIKSIFGMDSHAYLKFVRERKEFLVAFILNGINYQQQ